MNRYRLSKYNPKYRNSNGIYLRSEWSGFGDIGRKYNGKVFTQKEYLDKEEQYCVVISEIAEHFDVDTFVMESVEMYSLISDISELLNTKGLSLSENDIEILRNIRNNLWVDIDELEDYLKLILRECFWCRLVDLKKILLLNLVMIIMFI